MKDRELDGVWAMQTQLNFMSKAAFTGLRNQNLFRIDTLLKDMH